MGLAAQFGFPLDIDHTGFPHVRLGGNPGRSAERNVPELIHRQGVYLSHDLSFYIEQNRLVGIGFMRLFLVKIVPETMLLERLDHVLFGYGFSSGFPRPIIGFCQNTVNWAESYRQLILVGHLLFAEFHDGSHPGRRQGQQFFFLANPGYKLSVLCHGFIIAIGFMIEIGANLKNLIKFGIVVLKQMKQPVTPQKNDLHIQGNRLGP